MLALRNLRVGSRLGAGFGLLLLFIMAIIGLVLYGNHLKSAQFEKVVDVNMVKMRLLNDMLDTNNAVLMHRRLMVIKRGEDFDRDYQKAQELSQTYDGIWAKYIKIPRDATGDTLVAKIEAARKATDASTQHLHERMKAGDFDGAAKELLAEHGLATAWNEAISTLLRHQEELTARSREEYRSTESWTGTLSIVFGVMSLLLGSLAAWAITRSLTRPLEGAVKLADGIAGGRLDSVIDASGNDEVTQLLRSMQRMQAQLQSVMAAQGELARQHDAGSLSYRMDESAFPGDYGRMVHETNALVGSHVQVQNRLIEVMKHYARGDLSVDMDPLPGEKAAITLAMDETKSSLSAINSEIRRLATAAAAGDFSLRGDEDRFAYDFRDMVAGLNRLMQTTDENLVQVSTLLQAISRGDLTVRMQGDFHGVFARMRDDCNATVDQLKQIVGRIQSSASSINLAAGEIASGNTDLSRRTEQQAANLVVQHHGFVVAEHEVHCATGGGGLLLQAVQQPEGLGHLRAAVEHIAGNDQRVLAQRPAVLCVDDLVGAQQAYQQPVLAMDVGQRNDARHGRQHGNRRRIRGSHMHRVLVAAARGDVGACGLRGKRVRLDLVVADPLGLQLRALAEYIGAIGLHVVGGRGNLAGLRGSGATDQQRQQQGGHQGRAIARHRRRPAAETSDANRRGRIVVCANGRIRRRARRP